MHKFIKKIWNGFVWSLLIVVLLVMAISLTINLPTVQNKLTAKALEKVTDMFGNNITYDNVKLHLFNRASFTNLLIKDQSNDTLVFAGELKANIPGIMRNVLADSSIPLRLKSIQLDESYIRLYTDSTYTINLRFIPDSLKVRKDTSKPDQPFYIDKIEVTNSRVDIHHFSDKSKGDCIDFSKMTFSDFNLDIENFMSFKDTIRMEVNHLNLKDKSGFILDDLKSSLEIQSDKLHFSDISFKTNASEFKLDKVFLDFNDFADFADGGVFNKVKMSIVCSYGDLNLGDLAWFTPNFKGYSDDIILSGNFYGSISNLNGRNVRVKYRDATNFYGDIDIIGLPDPDNTFVMANINDFTTNTNDINNFSLPNDKKISIPNSFSAISSINYSGGFTGFFKDFVSHGTFHTNLGDGQLDVSFKPDTNHVIGFSGELSTTKFNLDPIVESDGMIGNISFNLHVEGRGQIDKDFQVILDGNVNSFEVNGYNYQKIFVDGIFSDKRFNGTLNVEDENLLMNFKGLVDLSSKIKKYNFVANVLNTNLYNLNINKKDPNYTASFLIKADLIGNHLDSLNGDVKLLNSLFANSDAQIQVYDLGISIRNDSIINQVKLNSEFVDGYLQGNFQLSELLNDYKDLVHYYFPALDTNKIADKPNHVYDLEYNLKFKNSLPLFNYFVPDFELYPYSYIEGKLERNGDIYSNLHIESPKLRYKNSIADEFVLNAVANDSLLVMDAGCVKLNLNKRINFENLTILSDIDSNKVSFDTKWLNWDSTLHKGNLSGDFVVKGQKNNKLEAGINVDSSFLVISDSIWYLDPFTVLLDTGSLQINGFNLVHENEYLKVDGALVDYTTDSLYVGFNDFNFGNLNFFTRSTSFQFGGLVNGKAMITGYRNPLFISHLVVDDLELNEEPIGDAYLNSKWNEKDQAIDIEANVFRGKLETLNIWGSYYPARRGEMNINLSLNKFRLNFINPYLKSVFSDVQGLATGLLTLTGTGKKPYLNGSLNLEKAGLVVDYLQTRYNFTSEIDITNNNFVFDHVVLYDEFINTAILNGMIRTKYLKEFELNLNLQPKKFFCLNTTFKDNKAFYGKAFATGLVRIQGPTQNLKFDINARTEPGTEFNVPLSESEEISEYEFIRMVTPDTLVKDDDDDEYKVNLSGLQLDLDLNVTPDAEVKIIFDPTLGDEITTRGNGDLLIGINSLGDFNMHGEYVVESGEYLFTLKDLLINKKFKVEQGSSLQWTGDPVNATVDISTYYRTKAELADLTGEPSYEGIRYFVDCQLDLTGRLKEPEINYNIYLPYAEQEERERLSAAIPSNEEMGKQFLSLLVLNRFIYSTSDGSSSLENSNIAGVNASELFSNQLSNWLSQISDEFDIGVNYRPGTELTQQEWEVALSTQLLDDRLSINGSVDMRTKGSASDVNNVLGNVDVDYKISRNGKLRARAYNRGNDNEMATYSKYTQGVGIFYTEEFDEFSEIGSWYKNESKSEKKKRKIKNKQDKAVIREEEINE